MTIIFGGFSADSIAGRINDCQSDYLITADEGVRGGKTIPLKKIADEVKDIRTKKASGGLAYMLGE